MTAIVPIVGGQYRFKLDVDGPIHIGVFVDYLKEDEDEDSRFLVHLYIEANTPANSVPTMLDSLCGLPDLK